MQNNLYIIAEIGINHDGNFRVAQELIDAAADAGADAVKFQYRNLERAYDQNASQIGDEILKAEITRNFLNPNQIYDLALHAIKRGLDVGISYFCREDFFDFNCHKCFKFYKIPSVEFANLELLTLLLDTKKPVYLSTGCQTEETISYVITRTKNCRNINFLHCVSNYPLAPHNSNLGYIRYFNETYNLPIGYSSHENDWKYTLYAVALGAVTIERHLTLGNRKGLDETTSSRPSEFKEMVSLLRDYQTVKNGYGPRTVNQGELLNRQNLGRSFYFNKDLKAGDLVKREDLVYMSPATGICIEELDVYLCQPVTRDAIKGEVLSKSMFNKELRIAQSTIELCQNNKISLPVRTHDFQKIRSAFPLGNYEFHLSYSELESKISTVSLSNKDVYSVHMPDYIDSLTLFNPLDTGAVGQQSTRLMKKVMEFAKEAQNTTGVQCPVICSFSIKTDPDELFYGKIKEFCVLCEREGVLVLPQWLPPIAWYFGGSVPLEAFNSSTDVFYIEKYGIPICFDSAHYLMGLEASFVSKEDFRRLLNLTKHIHIAGAKGLDGEGVDLRSLSDESEKIVIECFEKNCVKVIETWQGHLNDFFGFRSSIQQLENLLKT